MSRHHVTSDDYSHIVEITKHDEGYATAKCLCHWKTDPDRRDPVEFVIQDAELHVDGADR